MINLGSETITQAQVNAQADVALADYDAATGGELTAHNTVLTTHDGALTAARGGTGTIQNAYDEAWRANKHHHNYERGFGKSADQSGNDWAVESGLTAFVATSGANDFGVAIKVLGTADTPNQVGMVYYDPHKLLITDMNVNTLFVIRLIFDCDGDAVADTAEGKGYYSDTYVISPDTNVNRVGGAPLKLITKRVASGVRMWAKVKNAVASKTLAFYPIIHEYPVLP